MADKKTIQTIGTLAGGYFGGPLGAQLGGAIGGMFGGDSGAAQQSQADAILADVYERYKNLDAPTAEEMAINLAKYSTVGDLDPRLEQAEQLAAQDALQNIQLDPRLKNTQMDSLKMLEDISKGGLTPSDRAALNATRRQTQSDVAAQLSSMLQQQDQRGVGSSDAALALRANAAQSAANRQSQEMDRQQAMAFERALNATQQAGSLAGSLEQADYNRQANLANALNARELTNLNQRSGSQTRNIDRFNQAQQANLTNRQSVSNMNVGTTNQQEMHNKGLKQNVYDNELKKLSGMGTAGGAQAANLTAGANTSRQADKNFGEGIVQIGSGVADYFGFGEKPSGGTATGMTKNTIGQKKQNDF